MTEVADHINKMVKVQVCACMCVCVCMCVHVCVGVYTAPLDSSTLGLEKNMSLKVWLLGGVATWEVWLLGRCDYWGGAATGEVWQLGRCGK